MVRYFWDDDELLADAKKLLAESPDELKARLVAQAMMLQQRADEHVAAMTSQAGYSPEVLGIANALARRPELISSVVAVIEAAEIPKLSEDAEDAN